MRILTATLLLVALVPPAGWAACTGAQPTLCISLNQPTFQAGNALSLSATVTPGVTPPAVDVYVALQLPAGSLLFLQGNGTFTTDLTPLVAGWSPTSFAGQVFGYTFGGGEPGGTYTWLTAFTQPGTLDFIGGIASVSFQFTPPAANLSGTWALAGTITQAGCAPGYNGTSGTSGQVTLEQAGANLTGTGSISIPAQGLFIDLELTGTMNGASFSGSYVSVNNLGDVSTGFFSGTVSGTTLTVSASGMVVGSTCSHTLSLTGSRQ